MPSLSGELLPQGIVDSRTVYRGGLIEKPEWNGAPASGFREAKSIQSMYYALSSIAETEKGAEQESLESALSLEQDNINEKITPTIEKAMLDEIDPLSKEISENTEIDQAYVVMDRASFLETNGEITNEIDPVFVNEEDDSLIESTDEYENTEISSEDGREPDTEEIVINPGDMIDPSLEQMQESGSSEKADDQTFEPFEELKAVGEENWDDAAKPMPDENTAEEAELENSGSQFVLAINTMDGEARDELLVTMEDDVDTTTAKVLSTKEAIDVDETLPGPDEAIGKIGIVLSLDESGAIVGETPADKVLTDVLTESLNKETELDVRAEHVIEEDFLYEQTETDLTQEAPFEVESVRPRSNLNSDTLDVNEWISHGASPRKVEVSETNHVSASNVVEYDDPPLRTIKRIPLFQRMNIDISEESAFLRVVRRYAEANKRRLESIQKHSMTKSINGLEDVAALNDLFEKLRSVGIISKIKMFGKLVKLQDGSVAMGKKRKLSIELEWEMD